MKQLKIVQHQKQASESIDRLLKELAIPTNDTLTLNYGNAVLKTDQYQFFKDNNIPHPEWTTDPNVAKSWIRDGSIVVCRNRVRGQAGNGISLATNLDELVESKVYTKYIPKKREFRVNIFKDTVVNIREKVGRAGAENTKIRTPSNGYSTVKLRTPAPAGIEDLAKAAAKVSQSDFKGVDVCYNQLRNYLFVLEVNSGPAIEGASIQDYANAIRQELM